MDVTLLPISLVKEGVFKKNVMSLCLRFFFFVCGKKKKRVSLKKRVFHIRIINDEMERRKRKEEEEKPVFFFAKRWILRMQRIHLFVFALFWLMNLLVLLGIGFGTIAGTGMSRVTTDFREYQTTLSTFANHYHYERYYRTTWIYLTVFILGILYHVFEFSAYYVKYHVMDAPAERQKDGEGIMLDHVDTVLSQGINLWRTAFTSVTFALICWVLVQQTLHVHHLFLLMGLVMISLLVEWLWVMSETATAVSRPIPLFLLVWIHLFLGLLFFIHLGEHHASATHGEQVAAPVLWMVSQCFIRPILLLRNRTTLTITASGKVKTQRWKTVIREAFWHDISLHVLNATSLCIISWLIISVGIKEYNALKELS